MARLRNLHKTPRSVSSRKAFVKREQRGVQRLRERNIERVRRGQGVAKLPCALEQRPVVHSRPRPGAEVIDGLARRGQVEFAAQMGPANHAEDLCIHEMGRSLIRVGSQSASHGLSVGTGKSNLGEA